MRAVVMEGYGGPEVLRLTEVPAPVAEFGQVRVGIAATAINRADVLMREGRYSPAAPQPGDILGLEFAGTVDAVGSGIESWRVGDRVFGLTEAGGYAEQLVVHERMLMAIPSGMTFEEAAGIPEAFFTAYDALVERAYVELGNVVLIHAGGSGVGTAATQLAKLMGTRVFVTVGSGPKAILARELGADRAIIYREESFEEVVLSDTNGRGADVILDFVGGPYLERNIKAAAMVGRIVLIGLLGGIQAKCDLSLLLGKRLTLIGTTLRARPIEQKIGLTQRFVKQVLPLFVAGRLRPVIDQVLSLEQISDAHRYLEENRNFGKIVVRIT